MSRYIDADTIFDKVEANYRMSEGVQHECEREFLNLICDAPTVDAVQVPCYVGDEIWYVPDYNKKPFRAVCHCISIDKGGVRIHLYDMDGDNATYPARCIFKSKEDAERYCADGERRTDEQQSKG